MIFAVAEGGLIASSESLARDYFFVSAWVFQVCGGELLGGLRLRLGFELCERSMDWAGLGERLGHAPEASPGICIFGQGGEMV